jgi:hypothetical protein
MLQKRKPIGQRNGIKIYSTLKSKAKFKAKKPINQMSNGKYKQTKAEQKLKQELLIRCGGLCEICHQLPDWRGLSKHEKVFRSKGGDPLDPNNCVMTCGKCHSQKHRIKET